MDLRRLLSGVVCVLAGLPISQQIAKPATTLIAGSSIGPYRSTDGGATWKQIFITTTNSTLQGFPKLLCLVVDPQNPANVYAGANYGSPKAFLRSGDGGQTWSVISTPTFAFRAGAGVLAIDPVMTNVIYASTNQEGIQVSTDGGVTWTAPVVPNPLPGRRMGTPNQGSIAGVAVDPNHTGVVYVVGPDSSSGYGLGYVMVSKDYGQTWSVLAQSLDFSDHIFVDPANSQVLYGSNIGSAVQPCPVKNGGTCGLFKSTDAGNTWTALNIPGNLVQSLAIEASSNALYAWSDGGLQKSHVFKSSDGGATWTAVLENMGVGSFGKVVRVDPANPGSVYSIGPTGGDTVSRSTDRGATWSTVTLPDGCNMPGQLICSISFSLQDLVIVPSGSAAPAGPSISANGVINAASFQPGIVSNSWATILGTNLAPRTDDWTNAIVNGRLPTSLDGVSVSVGGKAAVVYFISAGQLNMLVPDLPAGPTTITVTTPAGASAAVSATVVAYAPAFFAWPGNQAVATRQDYSFAAKGGTFSGVNTTAAKPGDILLLWGTGFGLTNPAAPPGVAVPSGQPYTTATNPTVTIDNVPAQVFGAALSAGSVGLYQIAIQVPQNVPDGDWPIQASIGGVTSPTGILLSVHQ